MCMFCRSMFVFLYFFLWTLCCLFFFAIQILITPFVSSNSSSNGHSFFIVHCIIDLSLFMFFFVVLVLNYFHKQTLFRSASMLTTISTPVYLLQVTNGANDTTTNIVTPLYRRLCLLNYQNTDQMCKHTISLYIKLNIEGISSSRYTLTNN
jgi:hypothetical protein